MSEEKAINILKQFAEYTLPTREFENILYNDPDLKELLETKLPQTYSLSGSYLYLLAVDYGNLREVNFKARGRVEEILRFLKVPFQATRDKANGNEGLIQSCLPSYATLDEHLQTYIIQSILPKIKALNLPKNEEKSLLKEEIIQLFPYDRKPPKWIDNSEWPIVNGKPLYFLGQLQPSTKDFPEHKTIFYVFLNMDSFETVTIFQQGDG